MRSPFTSSRSPFGPKVGESVTPPPSPSAVTFDSTASTFDSTTLTFDKVA